MSLPEAIDPSTPNAASGAFARRTVRVIERRADGQVGFEFSIGWPELAVGLMLPGPAFAEFCTTHRALQLPERMPPTEESDE